MLLTTVIVSCATVLGLFKGNVGGGLSGGSGEGVGGYIDPNPEYQDLRNFIMPTADEVNAFINEICPNSPYAGHGDWFIECAKQNPVDPAWMIGCGMIESTLGTANTPTVRDKHNAWSIGATNFNTNANASSYSDWEDSLNGAAKALMKYWYECGQYTMHDIQFAKTEGKEGANAAYCCHDDGTPDQKWIDNIGSFMKKAPWRTEEKIAAYNAKLSSGGGASSGGTASGSKVIEDAIAWALDKCGKWQYTQDHNLRMTDGYSDCSSLVYRAYLNAGLDLMSIGATGTSTLGEVTAGKEVPYDSSKPIGDQVKRGDLLFTGNNSHVVLCLGNNEYVAASQQTANHAKDIKTGKLDYYNDKVYAIRRVVE